MEFVVLMVSFLFILFCVAYFVVLERNILGFIQRRHGPNKSGVVGLTLPLADGAKLFAKGSVMPSESFSILFVGSCFYLFFLSGSMWLVNPVRLPVAFYELSGVFVLCISGLSVFGLMLSGWSSGSSYGLLGAMRAIAQSISYEMVLNAGFFCPFLVLGSFELYEARVEGFFYFFCGIDVFGAWLVGCLAEVNRIPFDFVEGESELVSGYMVEYGGWFYVILALAEYSMVVAMSLLGVVLFFSGGSLYKSVFGDVLFISLVVVLSLAFLVVRGVLPRYRYDKLISLCWVTVLPAVSGCFLLNVVV